MSEERLILRTTLVTLLCVALFAVGVEWRSPGSILKTESVVSAQTNATPPLYWTNWARVYTSTTADFTATATSNIYDASNQPNLTIAVLSTTGVTAYTIVVETAPFSVAGANWAQVTTIDFTDDGSVASPKWQQVNIPGRYGKIRLRVTAITPGAGVVNLYLTT